MIIILSMNWLTSIMFISLNHPLTLGGILLMQTIMMGVVTGFLYYNFLFGYIIFLVMVSGLLIMFIYMTSIASNEKFKMPKTFNLMLVSIMMLTFTILITMMDSFFSNLINNLEHNLLTSTLLNNISLNKFYNPPFLWVSLVLMMYLLLTLFVIVKITNTNKGALRQK
uniref:NADH dehydrogenase subunit 6 n=1 Tax=Dendroctonus rufipennis TaxID=77170 RepID=UPI002027CD63|nr:NADH dehydrogenase subunit 6 [Dendroctonus rufipennis]UQK95009.1 NADH dehydrogenase subunit 6 [Dendroctonus rufipennis]